MRTGSAMLFLAGATAAQAHGSGLYAFRSEALWSSDFGVIFPLYGIAGAYFIGTRRLWRRAGHGRGVRYWQAACFWTGWAAIALALLSPLHWLSERLFAAHMAEHELIMLAAAPLFVVSRPLGALLWALPRSWRRGLGAFGHGRVWLACWHWITRPTIATLLHGLAIWGWHIPPAFTAALRYDAVHWLQHLSFLATALLFWWSLLCGRHRVEGYGAGIFWLFITTMHTSALGILLTLSKTAWIPFQTDIASGWGLTPLEDQQLAGLIMWIPAGVIYTSAALILAAVWIRNSSRPSFSEHVNV